MDRRGGERGCTAWLGVVAGGVWPPDPSQRGDRGGPIQKEETMVGNAHHAGPGMGWVNGSWGGSEGAWHGRGGEGGCRWINPKEEIVMGGAHRNRKYVGHE
jgi:hypothetical protein